MKKSFFGISSLMVALLWPMAPAQAQYTGPGAVQAITSLQQVPERPVHRVAVVLGGQLGQGQHSGGHHRGGQGFGSGKVHGFVSGDLL